MLLDPQNSNWKKFTDKYVEIDESGIGKEILNDAKVDEIVKKAGESLYAPTKKLKKRNRCV